MNHSFMAAAAALLLGFAFAAPAKAVTHPPVNAGTALVIPAGDEENAEIYHDLQTGITPPKAMVGDDAIGAQGAATEHPKEGGSDGNVENEEVWHDLRPGVTPPPAAVGK